jgi:hypothetical protein
MISCNIATYHNQLTCEVEVCVCDKAHRFGLNSHISVIVSPTHGNRSEEHGNYS